LKEEKKIIDHFFCYSKTEIDDMIRKPTNLLLTKTLKSALVDLTAAESELQLTFSQVNSLEFFF
jgi:hypothetical protein